MSWREIPPTAGMPIRLGDCLSAFVNSDGKSFEAELARYLNVSELNLLSSGTLCLAIAFEAIKNISGRRRVIVPAYTCPLLAVAAKQADVDLLLCDLAPDSFRMDASELERLCDQSVAAIVPTYLGGLPYEIGLEMAIAKSAGAYVVEDSAQALGASRGGKILSCEADVAVFSLAIGKGLSLYDGGLLCVKDERIQKEILQLIAKRVPANAGEELLRCLQFLGLALIYNPVGLELVYGAPLRKALSQGDLLEAVGEQFDLEIPAYKFGEFRKRAGIKLLERLPSFVQANRVRAISRCASLSQIPGLQVLGEFENCSGSWPFIMLLARDEHHRDAVMNSLWTAGLGVTRLFISALPDYSYLRQWVPQVDVPNARSFASRGFSISNSHWLTDAEFDRILNVLGAIQSSTISRTM